MMKKYITLSAAGSLPFLAQAQPVAGMDNDGAFHAFSILFAIGLFAWLILAVLKKIIDYKIKTGIIEKNIPADLAATLLKNADATNGNADVKSFVLCTGTGIGLTIIYFTAPVGIHSLAIMAFCLAASYLVYHLFLGKTSR